MSIFPPERVREYLSSNTIPEEFIFPDNNKSVPTIEDLCQHGKSILRFLEENKAGNYNYPTNGVVFQSILTRFDEYYRREGSHLKSKESLFELIRIEQSLHFINQMQITQDISAYLLLVEEFCYDEKLCELILLLTRKYDTWYEQYSELYLTWMHFVVPFVEYMKTINFEFDKMYQIEAPLAKEMIRQTLDKLHHTLKEQDKQIIFNDQIYAETGDLCDLLRPLNATKEALLDKNVPRNKDFYQIIGQLSFLYHVVNRASVQDYTFPKMCIIITLYFPKIKQIVGQQPTRVPTFFEFEKLSFNNIYYRELVRELCYDIRHESKSNKDNLMNKISLLECILSVQGAKALNDSKYFLQTGKGSELPLLTEIARIIFDCEDIILSHQKTYYGDFLTYYEYSVVLILTLTERIQENLGNTSKEAMQVWDIASDCILPAIKLNKIRLFVKDKYYARIYFKAVHVKDLNFNLKTIENLNFSDQPLEHIISSHHHIDLEDLYINLSHTLRLFKGSSEFQNLYEKEPKSIIQVIKGYTSKLTEGEIDIEHDAIKLKYIGIFLVGAINYNIPDLVEFKVEFLTSFIKFITREQKKCRLCKWDIAWLQENLWIAINKTPEGQKIMFDQSTYDLLAIFRDSLAITQKKCVVFPTSSPIMGMPEVQQKIYEMIITELTNTVSKEIPELWNKICNSQVEFSKDTSLHHLKNWSIWKFIYFTLPWTDCLLRTLKPKDRDEDLKKIDEIFISICSFYFHPVNNLLLNRNENQTLIHKQLSSFTQINDYILWATVKNLSAVLNEKSLEMDQELSTKIADETSWTFFINQMKFESSCLPIFEEQPITFAEMSTAQLKLQNIMLGLTKLSGILNRTCNCPFTEDQQAQLINAYKPTLASFRDFILKTIVWLTPLDTEGKADIENQAKFTQKLISATQTLLKLLSLIEKARPIIAEFVLDLTSHCLDLFAKPCSEHLLNLILSVILNLGSVMEKQILYPLLCNLKIWKPIISQVRLIINQLMSPDQISNKMYQVIINKADAIRRLIFLLQPKFKTAADFTEIDRLSSKINPGMQLTEFKQSITSILLEQLRDFPVLEMLTINKESLNGLFTKLLMILEISNLEIAKSISSQRNRLRDDITSLEHALNRQKKKSDTLDVYEGDFHAMNSMFGDEEEDYPVEEEEEEEKSSQTESPLSPEVVQTNPVYQAQVSKKMDPECTRLEGLINEKKDALKQLKEADNEEFFSAINKFGILYSFEDLAKTEPKKIESIRQKNGASMVKFLHTFNCKIIKESCSDSPLEQSEQNKFDDHILLLEVSTTKKPLYNNILTLEVYLQPIINLLAAGASKIVLQDSFLQCLIKSSIQLFEEFIKNDPAELKSSSDELIAKHDFFKRITALTENETRLLLTYFTCNYLHDQMSKDQSILIFRWVKLIVHTNNFLQKSVGISLINPLGQLFVDLMGLLQISLYSVSNSEYMELFEQTQLLETLLQYESKQAMKMAFIRPLTCIFDTLLEKSVSSELSIEREIKGILLNSAQYKLRLMDITSNNHIVDKEKCAIDALVSVIQSKFKVSSKIEDPNSETRFAPENIYISIDLARESRTPFQKINEIIQAIAANAIQLFDRLADAIISHFLETISKLTDCTDPQQVYDLTFKETSSLVTILSLIFQKHKHMLLYGIFKKKDYRATVQKFNSKLDFLGKVNIEHFKSVTFLECLFKINYFSFYAEDLIILIRTFVTPTGVTFLNPQDKETVVDVSHLILNMVLRLLHQDLLQRNQDNNTPSINSYLAVCTTTRAFGFIWYSIDQSYPKPSFQKYFKEEVLSLLKDILSVTKLYIKLHYNVIKSGGSYEEVLMSQLKAYRSGLLSVSGISTEGWESFKRENYKELLERDCFGNHISGGDIRGLFDAPQPTVLEDESAIRKCYPYSESEEKFKIDVALKAINRNTTSDNYFMLPLYKSSSVSSSESWSSMTGKKCNCLRGITTWCRKNLEINSENEGQLQTIVKNLVTYLDLRKFDLESNSGFYRSIPAPLNIKNIPILDSSKVNLQKLPNLTTRFYQIVADELKAKSQAEKYKNEKVQVQHKVQSEVETAREPRTISQNPTNQEEQKIEGSNPDTQEQISEEDKIQYFFHPTIQQRQEFDFYRQKITSRLKVISEKVLIATMHSGLSNGLLETFQKDVVNEELKHEVISISEFERNMLYCLVNLYDTLKQFEYPANIQEIQAEFEWIQNNFTQYIARLDKVREPTSTHEDLNSNIALEFTFPEEFQFVTDVSVNSTQQNITIENTKNLYKAKASWFQEMYLLDEDVVESLVAYFYMADDDTLKAFAPSPTSVLLELCYSPQFEAKIIDFCLFFIYCPEHFEILSSTAEIKFPYTRLLNTDLAQSNSQIYQIVTNNILGFLKSHLTQYEYLVYQPRTYIEQFGFKSIRSLKPKTDFVAKTKGSVSISDLIIGLIDVKEINSNPKLLAAFEDLIVNGIFSKNKDFKILEIREGEEFIERKGVLSFESCYRMLRLNKSETLLKKFPAIWLYNYKVLLKDFEDKVDILSEILDQTNRLIKKKIAETNENLNQTDLAEIISKESVLIALGELLGSVSSVITAWFVDKTKNTQLESIKDEKSQETERLYEKLLKALSTRFLNEKLFEDFMIQLFELASYLALRGALQQQSKLKALGSYIVKICLPFYSLICIQESFKKSNSKHKEESQAQIELPYLSHIVSTESMGENQEVPALKQTFSSLRRSREFDFSVLFSDLCKKHSDSLLQIAFEDTNKTKLTKELNIICSKLPWILDLSTKRRILNESINRNLKEIDTSSSSRNIVIDRKNLLKSTLLEFSNRPLKILRKKISINFTNEQGTDAGGLTREFLTIINRELFDPRNGLFQLSANQANIQPSPTAKVIPSHLKYLQLAGMALAKAIQHECVVDVNLSKPFLKHILKKRIVLNDLEDIDSDLAKSLKWMLENSVEVLEQPFTYEAEILGQNMTKELAPNGYDTTVDEENKKTFVKRVCEMKMREEIQQELLAFLQGFYLMIPPEFLSLFSASELQLLIAGIPTISVEDLKTHANLSGYTKDSDQIKWLWEIFSEFSQKELASFVFFVSGSLKIPYGGYKERPIRYRYASFGANKLPVAHTCSWEIELPAYKTKEELKQKLLLAIYEGQESFMLN